MMTLVSTHSTFVIPAYQPYTIELPEELSIHKIVPFDSWCVVMWMVLAVFVSSSISYRRVEDQKNVKRPGRPPVISTQNCTKHIQTVAPRLLFPQQASTVHLCQDHQVIDTSKILCPIFCDVLDASIELIYCGKLI